MKDANKPLQAVVLDDDLRNALLATYGEGGNIDRLSVQLSEMNKTLADLVKAIAPLAAKLQRGF